MRSLACDSLRDWSVGCTHGRPPQVYKKLGDQSKAMVHLTRALDLSPKDAQQIKAAILNLEKEDNAEEEEL